MLMSEIRDNSESSNWAMEKGDIKLCKDACATSVAGYENKRSKVSCMHLPVESFLDGCVAYEYKVAKFKVITVHGIGIFQFKSDSSLDASFVNLVMKVSEV